MGTSFESQGGYSRILNGGYDIYVGDAGSFTTCVIIGCRTEGAQFFYNGGAVVSHVYGCSQGFGEPGILPWQANFNYSAGSAVHTPIVTSDNTQTAMIFHTVSGGLSGGVEPTWPKTGSGTPVVDNAVTWNETVFDVVKNFKGTFDFASCKMQVGRIRSQSFNMQKPIGPITSDYTMGYENIAQVDATGGPIVVTLPYEWDSVTAPTSSTPWIVVVKKVDSTANTVTVRSTVKGIDGPADYVIPGGSPGFVQVMMGFTPVTFTPRWGVIAHS